MTRLIGLTGSMGSGKSTVAALINGKANRVVHTFKFAQALYDMQEFIYRRAGMTPVKDRKLLQWLGTDWGRSIDPSIWINIWKKDVTKALEDSPTSLVVCDDVRFDNEAEAVLALGGMVVKIEATPEVRGHRIALVNTGHASENGINDKYVTKVISNNGSLYDLENAVKALLGV
jgi:hypothetical protein